MLLQILWGETLLFELTSLQNCQRGRSTDDVICSDNICLQQKSCISFNSRVSGVDNSGLTCGCFSVPHNPHTKEIGLTGRNNLIYLYWIIPRASKWHVCIALPACGEAEEQSCRFDHSCSIPVAGKVERKVLGCLTWDHESNQEDVPSGTLHVASHHLVVPFCFICCLHWLCRKTSIKVRRDRSF